MTFQQMMWKVAMLLFVAMMLVNVGVLAGGIDKGCDEGFNIACIGDAEPELNDFQELSDAVTNAVKEKW